MKIADGPTMGFGVGVTVGFTRADWAWAETANARHNNESEPNLINKVTLKRSAKFDYQTGGAVAYVAPGIRLGPRASRSADDLAHFSRERGRVVRNAVLYRPLDTAGF